MYTGSSSPVLSALWNGRGVAGGGSRGGGASKDSWVLGLRLGFWGGTFLPSNSPESDFFIARETEEGVIRRRSQQEAFFLLCELK